MTTRVVDIAIRLSAIDVRLCEPKILIYSQLFAMRFVTFYIF